ncbi:carbonic anhydrase [Marinococcus halophilus]|uniref:carbonic anhydrase n=1 Tax=Marinococcus halophilus TaxID=1371 RepID=UPI0009A6E9E2|nr:carbonic anhydrase family protein [Marinococcus halophilus]
MFPFFPLDMEKAPSSEKKSEWSYKGETGPEHWGSLDADYTTCTEGESQSPVNLREAETKRGSADVQMNYEPTNFTINNDGHTILAEPENANNTLTYDGEEYTLSQFHFHAPSEHQLNGDYEDMELHLVHESSEGEIVVSAFMLEEGGGTTFPSSFWDKMPSSETEAPASSENRLDLEELLPFSETNFQYEGSLTTPPCTEGVNWIVYGEPVSVSSDQLKEFQQIYDDNHRPVQPLNGREVMEN